MSADAEVPLPELQIEIDYFHRAEFPDTLGFYFRKRAPERSSFCGPLESITECLRVARRHPDTPVHVQLAPAALLLSHVLSRVPNCPMPNAWGFGKTNALVWPAEAEHCGVAVVVLEHFDGKLHVLGQNGARASGLVSERYPFDVNNIPEWVYERLSKLAADALETTQ